VFAILAVVYGGLIANRQTTVLLTLLTIAVLVIVRLPVLQRRMFRFWSPRKHPTSGAHSPSPSASSSSAVFGSNRSAHEQDQRSDPTQNAGQPSPSQASQLREDFERALAQQQQSTLQVIKRQEQLIGDLSTIVRILQERVLIQQQQLDALGAPSAAQDPTLSELERLLPFGKVTFEQMLQLSDHLNERLHLPPFSSYTQQSPAPLAEDEAPS
jgi:hypothetical protein